LRARGGSADEYRAVANRDRRLVLSVTRVEVWRLVIPEVHRDHDAVEEAYAGHGTIM